MIETGRFFYLSMFQLINLTIMTKKENKGGTLTNEQVEQDLRVKQKTTGNQEPYHGSQDNGETTVRHLGSEVQQADGRPPENKTGE